MIDIPVVVLAGGRGSRLGATTDIIPKPMVEVQGVPMIERIMRNFRKCGFRRFIVSAGYKHEVISEYFNGTKDVLVVNTGENTQTAGRILGVRDFVKDNCFMACYGDGLTDYNPCDLLSVHLSKENSVCTMLAVHPIGRFGEVDFDSRGMVTSFVEKPLSDRWINGGYFCFGHSIFDYLSEEKILETDIFPVLLREKKLFCDSYCGFWKSMDTPKDLAELNNMELPK